MSNEVLNNIVEDIVKKVNPTKVILFGSTARGETNKDSDLDLLIIEKDKFNKDRSRRKELHSIRQLLIKYRIPKDILLYDEEEVEYWKDSANHIIARCLKEGTTLYER
ncbi:MAG: nucleotidyltransferase domain-containing protein [Ignavibacteria bacterium]|nr:nucleotidyltransferase domain-containing protein [Ignavibacteria bacterium]